MLERTRHRIAPSARSDVPPFMVMDVMAAAARIEARGGRVVHMEVGQPAAPAPQAARRAARAALDLGDVGYTEALGIPALRAAIARQYPSSTASPSSPRASSSPPAPRRVSSWRSSRCSSRATGSRSRVPLSAVPAYPDRARLRAGDDRDFAGDALVDHGRRAARGASPHAAQGRAGREPGQSDRHHDVSRGAERADRRGRTGGYPLHFR